MMRASPGLVPEVRLACTAEGIKPLTSTPRGYEGLDLERESQCLNKYSCVRSTKVNAVELHAKSTRAHASSRAPFTYG